ncbi:unnamed protein product [marine sediment metagenome]|uniref:Uncharacterized protein n=1 Tax=marine sediment metagenome TaxID=412755 RepID=X0XBN8_9ZZZZ
MTTIKDKLKALVAIQKKKSTVTPKGLENLIKNYDAAKKVSEQIKAEREG